MVLPVKRAKYYVDFFTYPALLLLLFWQDGNKLAAHPIAWAAFAVTGFVMWTLAEYWLHRSILHGPYWMRIHEIHHKRPRDLTDFPIWQIPSYFLAIYALVWLGFGDWRLAVYAGIMVGWILFFTMHHVMHHHPHLVQAFAIRHNAHHKTTTCNYGITVDWWDRVFGTFRR